MPQAALKTKYERIVLGDEAVAQAAIDAGITSAYSYPGTPSTEILEYILRRQRRAGRPTAEWCANEKTAYEEALGASMVGCRALVSMKHVGLNVAADPFVNSAIVPLHGGLVLAIADDPGMHSSQNEQDSRFYADFARVICLEPATHQEAYDMAREAFDLSEQFCIPVVIRLVTRLAHSRSKIRPAEERPADQARKIADDGAWILLPANARKQWHAKLAQHRLLEAFTEASPHNRLELNPRNESLGVITSGVALNYYLENLDELMVRPSHLHIGAYPIPVEKVRELAWHVSSVLVLEEGFPYVERYLRGVLPQPVRIRGKLTGEVPEDGELDPDIVAEALGLHRRRGVDVEVPFLPKRPPQLCQGCPHGDVYKALKEALAGREKSIVMSDIGCYTLGALPPHSAIESCVCMGASIGMAKGAAEAGLAPAVAVIGDSTFLHSGVTPLIDAVAADANITVLILDNGTIAMTGGQETILPSSRLESLIRGLGVPDEHFHLLQAAPRQASRMTEVIRGELAHDGLSVIIFVRECLETARRRKAARR